LEASNTGAFAGEEVVLDTRTAQTGWSASEERAFDIASPGVYLYYRLDVTANNGFNSLVVAELNLYNSLDAYLPLDNVEITSQTLEPEGQTLDVIVRESLSAYPDNTLCMYIEDEYYAGVKGAVAAAGPAGRRQLKFWGWVASQELRVFGDDTARRTETVLHCVDPGQRLRALPAWNMMWLRKYSPNYSYEMRHPNMDRLIWFAMRYLSTACEVTDFRWSGTLEQYGVGVMAAYGESVYDLADFCAVAPSMRLTSNKFGKLQVKLDPILFSMLAISTHVALTEDDYTEFNWTHDKNSQYHWAWESALATQNQDWDSGGFAITTHFAVSPGKAPGQGVQTVDLGEQIVSSFWGTTELAFRAGNRYASRLNPDDANATLTLAHGNDGGIDPAEMLYLTLTLGAAYAPVTGQTFTTQKFWPTRLTIEHNNEASLKTVRLDLEQCILGEVATAYTPPA
jgi:hypothetical protein